MYTRFALPANTSINAMKKYMKENPMPRDRVDEYTDLLAAATKRLKDINAPQMTKNQRNALKYVLLKQAREGKELKLPQLQRASRQVPPPVSGGQESPVVPRQPMPVSGGANGLLSRQQQLQRENNILNQQIQAMGEQLRYNRDRLRMIQEQGAPVVEPQEEDPQVVRRRTIDQMVAVNRPMIPKPYRGLANYQQFQKLQDRRSNYGFKEGGYLQSFPQWAVKNAQRQQKVRAKRTNLRQHYDELGDHNSNFFNTLQRMSTQLARWSDEQNRWVGKYPAKVQKSLGNMAAINKRNATAQKYIMSNVTTVDKAITSVPPMIRAIVQSNQALSSTGFGPVKQGGINLYAGRWLDTQTGRVRILPQANAKYLNPSSREQRLGYLQAKMLNHWNNLVSSYEQYLKFKNTPASKFQQKLGKSIENGLDLSGLLIKYSNSINRKIISYYFDPPNSSFNYLLIQNIPQDYLKEIKNIQPTQIQDTQQNRLDEALKRQLVLKGQMWETAIVASQKILNQRIDQMNISQLQKDRFQIDLNRAVLNMVAGPGRSLVNTLNKLQRIALIPENISGAELIKASQSIDTAMSANRQAINRLTTNGYNKETVENLRRAGTNIGAALTNGSAQTAIATMAEGARNLAFQGGVFQGNLTRPRLYTTTQLRNELVR